MSRDTEYHDQDEDFDEAPGDDGGEEDEDFDEAPDDDGGEEDEDFDEAPDDDGGEEDEDFDEAPDDDGGEEDEDFDEAPDDDGGEEDEDFDEAPDDDADGEEDNDDKGSDDDDGDDFEENSVFVIMHYSGEECDRVFSAIKTQCSLLGLEAEIAKNIAGSGLVIQDIYNATCQAEFLVCDLTGERQNVYFELGQAHGLGNNAPRILLIAKESTKVHFDVAPFRVHFYRSLGEVSEIVRSNLSKMMQLTRSKSS